MWSCTACFQVFHLKWYLWGEKKGVKNKKKGENEGRKKHFGLIAQELKLAMDESGFDSKNYSIWDKDDYSIQSVAYVELVPLLIKAVQELSSKVQELESKLS